MPDQDMSVLSIREFPLQLLTALKMAALRNQKTLREHVIDTLQQTVDNDTNSAPTRKKS